MEFDVSFLTATMAVFLAGFVRGFSGFGTGMILVPVLSLLYSPAVAVVSVVLLEIVPTVQMLPAEINKCDWRSVVPMSIAALFALPFGSYILVNTSADVMRVLIALLLIISVMFLLSGQRMQRKNGLTGAAGTGIISGVISGASGLGGVPVMLYFLSGCFNAKVVRASLVVFLALTTLIALASYAAHGIIRMEIVLRVLCLVPVFILAIWSGGKFFGKVSEPLFRKITLGFLGGVGILMLVR